MKHKLLRTVLSSIAAIAALAHVARPDLRIDGVTVTLIAIALLPWLSPIFRAVELPGGLKVEYQDLKDIADRAEEVGLIRQQPRDDSLEPEFPFEGVAREDPLLGLAGLRIEIERQLRAIAESHGVVVPDKGISALLLLLGGRGLLTGEEMKTLQQLVGILNAAVHGKSVDDSAAEWALTSGKDLVLGLQARVPKNA
jgi:hypothetical protein